MNTVVYAYKTCSTCKKALRFLTEQNIVPDVIDIVAKPPTMAQLEAMLARYDGQIRKLFNTSGESYRALGMKDKMAVLSQAELLGLLAKDGKLVKRPFLMVSGKAAAVGFDAAEWAAVTGPAAS